MYTFKDALSVKECRELEAKAPARLQLFFCFAEVSTWFFCKIMWPISQKYALI